MGHLLLLDCIATIFAANWAVATFGFVPVGFGLVTPAGVYLAGLAFTLRDLVQETLGKRATFVAIALGGLLSAWLASPALALASAAAFLCLELADFAVYTPLRQRHWTGAVLASNLVGIVFDSALCTTTLLA